MERADIVRGCVQDHRKYFARRAYKTDEVMVRRVGMWDHIELQPLRGLGRQMAGVETQRVGDMAHREPAVPLEPPGGNGPIAIQVVSERLLADAGGEPDVGRAYGHASASLSKRSALRTR